MTTELALGIGQIVIAIAAVFLTPFLAKLYESRSHGGLTIKCMPKSRELESKHWNIRIFSKDYILNKNILTLLPKNSNNVVNGTFEYRYSFSPKRVSVNALMQASVDLTNISPSSIIDFDIDLHFKDGLLFHIDGNIKNHIIVMESYSSNIGIDEYRYLVIAKWRALWIGGAFSFYSLVAIIRIITLGLIR